MAPRTEPPRREVTPKGNGDPYASNPREYVEDDGHLAPYWVAQVAHRKPGAERGYYLSQAMRLDLELWQFAVHVEMMQNEITEITDCDPRELRWFFFRPFYLEFFDRNEEIGEAQ